MQRLVIALTALLTLVGAAVVAGYLFIFGPSVDRAATLAPSTSLAYVSVSLTPSTGQEMDLADLLAKLPGFSDRAALATKIDEIVQRSLSQAGIDYHAEVAPWLGDRLAVALVPSPAQSGIPGASPVLLMAVRDEAAARSGVEHVAQRTGSTLTTEQYQGATIDILSGGGGPASISRLAIVDRMMVAAPDEAAIRAVIDVSAGRAAALAGNADFRGAMSLLPADRVASLYVSVSGVAALTGQILDTSGYSSMGLAVVVRAEGLQVVGRAPFDAGAAGASTRAAVAQARDPSVLPEWMPADTQAELVFFDARQAFESLTRHLSGVPGSGDLAQALTQIRTVIALGLGVDLDRDILPLFDRDAAIALQVIDATSPRGQLLLRPSDPAAAGDALQRMVAGLRDRGSQVQTETVSGATLTSITVPQVGGVAFASQDGVIVVGLTRDDVAAALTAHASGETLAASTGYRAAFDVAGGRSGNELYLLGTPAVQALGSLLGQPIDALPADVRDILTHIGAFALSASSQPNQIGIHATVTVR